LRAELVNGFLQANGIPPSAQLPTGSLASASTLERRQEFSFAILGIRDTVTLVALQTETRRLDTVVAIDDDFANSNVVQQRGVTTTWSHRLTPQSALNLVASYVRTRGSINSPTTNLHTIGLNWSSQLGPRSSVVLGARHAIFKDVVAPYTESALIAFLNYRL
jgi:uncharacterized protein (PEP-CTERM system associated)